MDRHQKIKKLFVIIFIVTAAMFVSFFLYLGINENITVYSPRYSPYYGKIINLTPETIKDETAPMGQRTVYSWLMDAHCEMGDYLCFYIPNNHVDITVDGELIYSLHASEETLWAEVSAVTGVSFRWNRRMRESALRLY